MTFTLRIDCDNAAFDVDPRQETARILHEVATRLARLPDDDRVILFDINGNRVGHCGFRTGA